MDTSSRLYKYTSPESAEQILVNTSLKWSSPVEFGDPEELQKTPVLFPSIDDSMPNYIDTIFKCAFKSKKKNTEKYSKEFAEIAEATKFSLTQGIKENHLRYSFPKLEIIHEITKRLRLSIHNSFDIKSLRILCLTKESNNSSMWTRYASDSTGCCIEFTTTESSQSYFSQARNINYSTDDPIVGQAYDMLVYGIPDTLEEKAIDALYYTKKPHWSYENEWRIITSMPDEIGKLSNLYKFNPQDLTAITFGHKANQYFIDKLSEIALQKYANIKIFKVETANDDHQLLQLK